jgi:hypothetical protein
LRATAIPTFAALAMILFSARAAAQDWPAGSQAETQPPKEPAPPLFPRHSRGLYRNAAGVELIDATPQSPPLDTDDPAVPNNGVFELNFTAHADYARAAQRIDLLSVDANDGLIPAIAGYQVPTQLKFEFPVAAARTAGDPFAVGLGTASFGVKFNFYHDEHRGMSMAVYPQVEFAAPAGGGVEKGLAERGQTVILPVLIAREFHEFTFVFNGSLEKPLHDPERQTASGFGVGFGRAFTRKVAGMFELRSEASLDFKSDRLVVLNAGLVHGVRGIILYANVGHSLLSDDGKAHTYAGFGMKALLDTKKK